MATLFTVLLGISGILLVYALYDLGERSYIRETGAAIDSEMALILDKIENIDAKKRLTFLKQRTVEHQRAPIFYYSESDEVLIQARESLPQSVKPITEGLVTFKLKVNNKNHRFAGKIHTFQEGHRLLVCRDIEDISTSYSQLKSLSFLILIFMIIVVLASFFISTFVVRRINLIANTAQSIMDTNDLSHRISIKSRWDDISNLAYILNQLLIRIEQLMLAVKDAGHSIAHDLRTPLTRLRTHLDQAKSESTKKPVNSEVFDGLIKETDQILTLFTTLLKIGSLEAGNQKRMLSRVDLLRVIQDVIELYEPLAETKQIMLHLDCSAIDNQHDKEPFYIKGNPDLLFQLFTNLVDNAIKFTPYNGKIFIDLLSSMETLHVAITDTGMGVEKQDLERVCDRFFRAEKSRTSKGSGLGLSLVKAAVTWHEGQIKFASPGYRLLNKSNVKTPVDDHPNTYGLTAEICFQRK